MTEPMEVSTEPGIECYAMNNMFRGHAVIIANENFTGRVSDRPGAKMDALKMEALFKALDFHVTVVKDCSASEMKHIIKQASKSYLNLDADCFALVLSTHGHEEQVTETPMHMHLPQDAAVWRHAVLGIDGEPLYVDEILEFFDGKSGESYLNGKPKLFFLQACRSGHLAYRDGALASYDTGAEVKVSISSTNLSNIQPSDAGLHNDTFSELVTSLASCRISQECVNETDSWLPRREASQQNVTGSVETDPNPVPSRPFRHSTYDIVALTCPDDCLIMYPVTSGKFAFRVTAAGSYMLHYMYQEMNRTLLLQGRDILQYLTSVNNAMASTEIYYEPTGLNVHDPVEMERLKQSMPLKMTASIVHRLTKSLKFKPKPQNSVMETLMKELRII